MSSDKPETDFDADCWIAALVAASSAFESVSDAAATSKAVVEFKLGRSSSAVVAVESGRVIGPADKVESTLTIPVTVEQLNDYSAGVRSMSRDYMRGDLKPAGPTGHFIALLDVFENQSFVEAMSGKA